MKLDKEQVAMLLELSQEYLSENIERYTEQEKRKFMNELLQSIKGDQNFIYDGVYDFLVYYNLVKGVSRHKSFANYITRKYSPLHHKKVLDVGAGRLCNLSTMLAKRGFDMFAMDPNIRLLPNEAKTLNIHIDKNLFLCDEFAKNKKGTNIKDFNLLIGLEPCTGTEHIIRQALKYDKPFDVVLCYEAHKALNGKSFKTVDEWFEFILKISKEISIIKHDGNYIATNFAPQQIKELEPEA